MTGRLIAVVGPSGVGKDSVMSEITRLRPDFKLARRVITRPAEAGGEDFEAVDLDSFKQRRNEGAFVLWWPAHGLYYGIPREIEKEIAAGNNVLVNLSRGVLLKAKAAFPTLEVIVLTASSSVLAQRLAARGREDAKEIAKRLERANYEIPDGLHLHTIENNGTLKSAALAVLAALEPEVESQN